MNTKHSIYTKDKKIKITFRCDDAMGDWVTERSAIVGLTPSAFVRQTLYQQMYAEKTLGAIVTNSVKNGASTETAVTKCRQQN